MKRREGNGPRPWRARHKLRGVSTQRSFRTSAEADEWLREEHKRYAREQAGLPIQQGPITYNDFCDLFLANYTAKSKSWLEGRLRISRAKWGNVMIHLLRSERIGAWLHTELDLTPRGKHHVLRAMRQVLSAAVEWDYIHKSPVRPKAVDPPPQVKPDVRPLESWAEVLAVADATKFYGPLVRFACATGLRPQEWSALEWHDIDKEARVVNVHGQKTDAPRRSVVLSQPALSALADVTRRLDTPLVFLSKKGKKIVTKEWGQNVWRPALTTAGLADRPSYQMRHTYATLALAQSIPLEWISGQMGHKSLEVTRTHYARFVKRVDDRMRALLDQMESEDESYHPRTTSDQDSP